jgi:lipopolysaccharide export system protein LptA
MLKRLFSRTILTVLLALAVIPASAYGQSQGGLLKGPVVITSSTLSADAASNTAVFEGSVVATSGDLSMYADKMTVYYTKDGDISKIEAIGGIKLVKGERTLTSEKATYLAEEGKITFTGDPRAVEGVNTITGSKIVYLIDEDRSIVHDSKVFIGQDIKE